MVRNPCRSCYFYDGPLVLAGDRSKSAPGPDAREPEPEGSGSLMWLSDQPVISNR